MTAADQQRRLAAIMATDIVGYTEAMSRDEPGTLTALRHLRREVLDPEVARYNGRIFKTLGDGVLVEFSSVVHAVECALSVQKRNAAQPDAPLLRIGVALGDIFVEDGEILGDGVNMAARLEALADPGGITLTDAVHQNLKGRIDEEFADGGAHDLRNGEKPARVWMWPATRSATVADAAPVVPDKPSIAVLPFDNLSDDPQQVAVADGIVESITAVLSRIRDFFVIARNSAFVYKGRPTDVKQVGKELGVAYVLEGSVQRAGQRIRVTVQLVETRGGAHIWAEKYDADIDDLFDLQDDISERVAGQLQPSIRRAEIERARRQRPRELGAYGYTMRAMRHVWMLERDSADRALELLDEALAIDPDYALALALSGWCWAQRAVYNWSDDRKAAVERALKLAERAAMSGGEDPLTLTVLGTVHTIAKNSETARLILEKAIAIDPNSAWAWSRLGWLDAYSCRSDSAIESFRRALRLSPLDPLNFNNYVGLGAANLAVGRYAEAVPFFERALRERPDLHWIRRGLTACLVGSGALESARAMGADLLARQPDFTISRYVTAMPFPDEVCGAVADLLRLIDMPE